MTLRSRYCSPWPRRPDASHGLLGLRVKKVLTDSVSELAIEGKLFDSTSAEQHQVHLFLERRHWTWGRQWRGSGWRWSSGVHRQVVEQVQVRLDQQVFSHHVTLPSHPESNGWWVVRAELKTDSGLQVAEWQMRDPGPAPDQCTMVSPAAAVDPGSTIALPVATPFAGHALLTLEDGNAILAQQVLKLEAGQQHISLTIPTHSKRPTLHAVLQLNSGLQDHQGPV